MGHSWCPKNDVSGRGLLRGHIGKASRYCRRQSLLFRCVPTGAAKMKKEKFSYDYSCCQCRSSSLKYQLINMEDESVIAKGNCDRIGIDGHLSHKTASGVKVEKDCDFPTHAEAFSCLVDALTTGEGAVISSMDEISAVGHRVVQGAEVFTKTTLVTDEIIEKIDELRELAPVHNHGHALALWACRKILPNVPQVVVFDTAFHQTIPQKAFMYGFPYEDYEQFHVRKYGFHGTSHRYVSARCRRADGQESRRDQDDHLPLATAPPSLRSRMAR